MPCSPAKINSRFEGTHSYHLQGRIVSQARNQDEADKKQSFMPISCWAYSSTLKMEIFHRTIRRYILQSQAVRISNPYQNLNVFVFPVKEDYTVYNA
jgi:hypothetical protein